ncbi:hypothetical protein EYF80_052685 [Liparis tanakae]|uniref:Uncharacterized protein n=1 Tax=Liparis tanakae TaxID=230148 RepID=A0A4Z2F8J8_9TELE|nr:hypothetical protein EYF80_052685 [Liparis tanakae]
MAPVGGAGLRSGRVAEQEGVLVAAVVFVAVSGGRRAPGGLVGGGGGRRRRFGRRPRRRREEEGAVVGVLVEVGVGPPGLGRLAGRPRPRAGAGGGGVRQLVLEPLHLAGQPLHRVGVVGRHGAHAGPREERQQGLVGVERPLRSSGGGGSLGELGQGPGLQQPLQARHVLGGRRPPVALLVNARTAAAAAAPRQQVSGTGEDAPREEEDGAGGGVARLVGGNTRDKI